MRKAPPPLSWGSLCSMLYVIFSIRTVAVVAQGTDLGGGVLTRTDVEYLADLSLDVRDIEQAMASGGSDTALRIYLEGKNSEKQVGILYKLAELNTELSSDPISRATPPFLFHLYGLAGRSTDLDELAENGAYADRFVRSAIQNGRQTAAKAVLALNMWMYASHVLYKGMDTCQKRTEADNPGQFDIKGGGLDEFIALWIGSGQTHGSSEGFSLYALAEQADQLFTVATTDESGFLPVDTGGLAEADSNREMKLLYQEGAGIFSLPDVCTRSNQDSPKKLWSIVNQISSKMYIPLFRMLIVSILEQDTDATELYATALVPQASQCRPSTYNRLREELLQGNINFQRAQFILEDLQEIYACFGLSCDDVGLVSKGYDGVNIPLCIAAQDNTPMALYQPSSDVHPRNNDNDPFAFYSIAEFAIASSRRNAEPYYSAFVAYHNDPNYADVLIRETLDGVGKWGTGSVQQRSAVIAETSASQVIFLHLLAQINDAVNNCRNVDEDGEYDLTHPWDEVAALLIGSLEGLDEGGSSDVQDGQLTWGLSTRRSFQFQTLNGQGYAQVNSELVDLLFAGRGELDALECDMLEKTADKIKQLSFVPLMQSVLRYAIQNEQLTADSRTRDLALGEVFALAIIPIVQIFDPESAALLEENMIVRQGVSPVRDGSQEVANALGSAAVSVGVNPRLLGSTPQANPSLLYGGSASPLLLPMFGSAVVLTASVFFLFW
ncbi:MAG: hypothetical protein SGILL_005758 [Bacillariaceae sp.]